jgi:hypothetical protein
MVAAELPSHSLHISERLSKEVADTSHAGGTLLLQLELLQVMQLDDSRCSSVAEHWLEEDHRASHIPHGASQYHISIAAEDQ